MIWEERTLSHPADEGAETNPFCTLTSHEVDHRSTWGSPCLAFLNFFPPEGIHNVDFLVCTLYRALPKGGKETGAGRNLSHHSRGLWKGMSLFFVVVLLLILSPAACRAFLAHGRQERAGRAVGGTSERGSGSGTAFVAPSTARRTESTARDAKPRYAVQQEICVGSDSNLAPKLADHITGRAYHVSIHVRGESQSKGWHRRPAAVSCCYPVS